MDALLYFYSIIDFSGNLRFDTDVAASHHFRLHSLNVLNTPVQFLFLLRVFYQLCSVRYIIHSIPFLQWHVLSLRVKFLEYFLELG